MNWRKRDGGIEHIGDAVARDLVKDESEIEQRCEI